MKLTRQPVLLAAPALLVLLLGALWWSGLVTQQKPDVANRLFWRAGNTQAYDVQVDSTFVMTLPGAGSGQTMAVQLDAVLVSRTLEVAAAEVLLGMRLDSMEMTIGGVSDAAANLALAQPFRVRIAANGLPRSFEFPASLAAVHREVIENLVRMFQLVIEDGESWVTREANAMGNYEASYTRVSPTMLVKKKERYVGAAAAMAATLPGLASEEHIRIDKNNDWITAMTLTETVNMNDRSGGPSVVVNNRASLRLRDGLTAGTAVKWYFTSTLEPEPVGKQAAASTSRPTPAISPERARRQLLAEVTALDAAVEGRSILIHRLRDRLLADDEMPFALLELMNNRQLADRSRADLYLVFELAGTAAAQAALASVFTDPGQSKADSMRAIVALGGVASPTDDAVAALWDTARGAGYVGNDLSSTAALALGSLGRNLLAAGDADYPSVHAGLLDGASSAADTHQRAVFLQALGNTGDPDPALRSNILPFLRDSAAEVRSAAASTLGRLGPGQVSAELLQSFTEERNDVVRGSITEALGAWEEPTRPALSLIRAAIADERDETVRYNMALILGKSLREYPENRAVLEQVLAVEQSKRIRQQIADMLFAPG